MNNKFIPDEINEQYTVVNYLDRNVRSEYYKLSNMILNRANEIFKSINKKIPKITKIPLFYTYFGDDYEYLYNHEEATTEFESYALDNDYLEQSDFDLIQTELLELYYLADTLIYHMDLSSTYDTYDVVYHCVTGEGQFEQIETLVDCFNE